MTKKTQKRKAVEKDRNGNRQKKMKASAARRWLAFDELPIGMAIVDRRFAFVRVNRAFCALLGYAENELKGRTFLSITSPEHRRENRIHVRKLFRGQLTKYYAEKRYVRKNGESVWSSTTVCAVRDAKGKFLHFLAMIEDIAERRRAEEELFRSRQMLQLVLDTIPQRVFWKDRNLTFLGCNRHFAVDAGLAEPGDIIGKNDSQLVWSDTAQLYNNDDMTVMEHNTPKLNFEEPQTRSNGSRQWLKTSKVPLHDQKGNVIGVLGTYEDITGRKRAEQALRESEERYRAFFENSFDAVLLASLDGSILAANAEACRIFGMTEEELIRAGRSGITDASDPRLRRAVEERDGTGRFKGELNFRRKDGTVFPGEVSNSLFTDRNGFLQAVLVIRDVSERKRAEEALRESMAALESVFKVAPVGIGVVSYPDRILLQVNNRISEMTGYAAEELIGNSARMLYPDDRSFDHVGKTKYDMISAGGMGMLETPWRRKDGKLFDVLLSSTPLDANNPFRGVTFTALDITERKRAEEILKRDKDTLERLVRESAGKLLKAQAEVERSKRLADIGMLASTMAHEMRNPLAAIKVAAYNIKRKISDPRIEGHLANINRKISEGDLVIQNLLGFAQLRTPRCEPIPLVPLLRECLGSVLLKYAGWNVKVEKKFSFAVDSIEADHAQVRMLFSNILDNAVQSLADKKGKISLQGKCDGDRFEIEIRDTGIGIDKEDLEQIYEPFFTRKSRGTGLGLTICRKIVDLHGGTITVASAKGAGTSVKIAFPRKRV